MTPQDLLNLAKEPDPLTNPDRPDRSITLPNGLLLIGADGTDQYGEVCDDLFLEIMPDGKVKLWWRDPPSASEPMWGDWDSHHTSGPFANFDDLRSFAYTL